MSSAFSHDSGGIVSLRARSLIVLACSKTKRPARGRALDVYDGPGFRTIRANRAATELDVVIVSAKYGAISGEDQIAPYDRVLKAGDEITLKIRADLDRRLATKRYGNVFVFLGPVYLAAVGDVREYLVGSPRITVANGGIGRRLGQLRQWLEDVAP